MLVKVCPKVKSPKYYHIVEANKSIFKVIVQ